MADLTYQNYEFLEKHYRNINGTKQVLYQILNRKRSYFERPIKILLLQTTFFDKLPSQSHTELE